MPRSSTTPPFAHRRVQQSAERSSSTRQTLAGPNGRSDPRAPPARARRDTLNPRRRLPDTSPPAARENGAHRRQVRETVRLGIAWTATRRCFFIDDNRRFVDGELPHRGPGRAPPSSPAGFGDPLRRAPRRAAPNTVEGAAAPPTSTAVGHAFSDRCATRRIFGERSPAYYFTTSTTPTPGTIPALLILEKLSVEGRSSALSSPTLRYFISRDQLEVAAGPAKMRGDSGALRLDCAHHHVRRVRRLQTTGTSTCARPTRGLCADLESLVSREDMERRRMSLGSSAASVAGVLRLAAPAPGAEPRRPVRRPATRKCVGALAAAAPARTGGGTREAGAACLDTVGALARRTAMDLLGVLVTSAAACVARRPLHARGRDLSRIHASARPASAPARAGVRTGLISPRVYTRSPPTRRQRRRAGLARPARRVGGFS